MKKIFIFIICFFSFSIPCFASESQICPQAIANTDPGFCPSFLSVAICHCDELLGPGFCDRFSLKDIYTKMIARFPSQDAACRFQKDTDYQTCMDDWNCARLGGRNSRGGLCSSTGSTCPGAT